MLETARGQANTPLQDMVSQRDRMNEMVQPYHQDRYSSQIWQLELRTLILTVSGGSNMHLRLQRIDRLWNDQARRVGKHMFLKLLRLHGHTPSPVHRRSQRKLFPAFSSGRLAQADTSLHPFAESDPSGWIQVLRGPRPKSVQRPLPKDRLQTGPQEGVSGRWRQPKSAKGAPPVGPRPRINPDVAREMAHTKVSRLEKALEAMGDLQGPVVNALKADLAKARATSKKPSVEVEIDECRKFISRAERRIRELDTEREKEQVSLVEAQERLERLVGEQSRCPETHDILPGSQVTALQQMVNLLQSERDALAKELTAARRIRPFTLL